MPATFNGRTPEDKVMLEGAFGVVQSVMPAPLSRSVLERLWRRCVAFAIRMANKALRNGKPQLSLPVLKCLAKTRTSETLVRILLARCACLLADEPLAAHVITQPLRSPVSRGRLGAYSRRKAEIFSELLDFDSADRCLKLARELLPESMAVNDACARYIYRASNDVDAAIGALGQRAKPLRLGTCEDRCNGSKPASSHRQDLTPYDRAPYESKPFFQTHPVTLGVIAMLHNHCPTPVERC